MTEFSGDISNWVLKGNVKKNIGEFSLDSRMLQVLMLMDGKTDVASISRKLKIALPDLRPVIAKLIDLGLVVHVQEGAAFLSQVFIDLLTDELSDAMGPIAEVILEDELEDMGGTSMQVPASQAAELINRLAALVPREAKRTAFQKVMLTHIKTM